VRYDNADGFTSICADGMNDLRSCAERRGRACKDRRRRRTLGGTNRDPTFAESALEALGRMAMAQTHWYSPRNGGS